MVISGLSAASIILLSFSLIYENNFVLNFDQGYLFSIKAGFFVSVKLPPSLTFSSIFCPED